MQDAFIRQKILTGSDAFESLRRSHVAVFGVGGVGSYAAEALARAGIGNITLIDSDVVDVSNINRQLIALNSTIGMQKTEVMCRRILDINPDANVICLNIFYGKDNPIDLTQFDYIADAIDSVSSKLFLVESAWTAGVPVISSMGAGNKFDPTRFEVCDIYETSVCPLARVMRKELKKRGVERLKVVYSKEEPQKPDLSSFGLTIPEGKRQLAGSMSYVPSVAGLILAGEIIRDLINKSKT